MQKNAEPKKIKKEDRKTKEARNCVKGKKRRLYPLSLGPVVRSSTFYFASLREISSNPLEIDILVGFQAVVVWSVGWLVG